MAKWIFVLLVLLNILTYAYQNLLNPKQVSSATEPLRIQEVQPQALKLLPPDWIPKEDLGLSEDETVVLPPHDAVVSESTHTQASGAKVEAIDVPAVKSVDVKQASAPGNHPIPTAPKELAIKVLPAAELAHPETVSVERVPKSNAIVNDASEEKNRLPSSACYRVSGLSELQHQKLRQELKDHRLDQLGRFQSVSKGTKKVNASSDTKDMTYQVYLTPSLADFSAVESKLERQGVEHFALRSEGRISLGVFKVKENAEQLLRKTKNMGFDVKIGPRSGVAPHHVEQKPVAEYSWRFKVPEEQKKKLRQILGAYGVKTC